ncbi:hypothetical protein [Prosthecodimorpha hirschii]|uniref:hypothetical protein n=1 Tax=Prosthecodimorpha hirschii TaxID=665126 RepID=UPI0011285B3A|nr:hypothetical protein [Prosthecomicrobium hirschii]
MPVTFLVFGEDDSDRKAIALLVKAFLNNNGNVKIKLLRKPAVLGREAIASGKRRKMAEVIAGFYRGFSKTENTYVIVHRDCDDIHPAHESCAAELELELKSLGVEDAIAATPCWEIESWWMLFPDAFKNVRACWNHINYGSTDVGMIRNAKEVLIRDLRPTTKRESCRDFKEDDGILIAEYIRQNPIILTKIRAQSGSFSDFRRKVQAISV